MGFIQKIKEFFAEKEEVIVETKKEIEDIDEWINKKDNDSRELFQEKKEILYNELNPLLNNLEKDTEKLADLDLTKYKSDEKILKMTELGRKEYIGSIKKLLGNLRKKEEYRTKFIKNKIEEFAKYSAKSDFKVTLLIGKEIENIRNDIIKISSLENSFLEENSDLIKKLDNIDSLQKRNTEIKTKEDLKIKMIKEIKKAKQDKTNYENKLEKIKIKIKIIKQSERYIEKQNFLNEKSDKEKKLKEEEFKIKTLIDKKLLEKYAYIEKDETIKKLTLKYLENTPQTLLLDNELEISNILKNIKEKIKDNTLNVKEPEKAIEKINIEKDILLDYKNNLEKLNEEIKKLNENIGVIKIGIKEIIGEQTRLEGKIAENQNYLSYLNKKQEKTDKEILEIKLELTNKIDFIK